LFLAKGINPKITVFRCPADTCLSVRRRADHFFYPGVDHYFGIVE
jgi:hypothetical protein